LPKIWGHIAKYMGIHFQIYGDTFSIQNIWGQIADVKEYIWNIIDYHAWHESTLHFKQQSGNLVFNRDMFLNIPLIADWHVITQRREHFIHENLMKENQKRRGYNYAPQKMVLKKNGSMKNWAKEQMVRTKIVQLYINGTVTIQLRPGHTERINTW
jgi:hypothetical protein